MQDFMDHKTAGIIVAFISVTFALFHLLVILGVVPDTIVWGGKIQDRQKLVVMELVSMIILITAGTLAMLRGLQVNGGYVSPLLTVIMWLFAALLAFNSFGNLFAETAFERWAFTPVTVLLSLMFIRLALKN